MTTSTRISRAGWFIAAALAIGLAACGSSSPDSTAQTKSKSGHRHPVTAPDARAPADMVAGVTTGRGGPPIELKFELRESPQAGQVLDVDIALVPDVPAVHRVYAKFQSTEGLDLVEGGELPAVEKPPPGTPIRHVVRVLPKQDGIFTLGATVAVDVADDSITRTYSIPVIVGAGLPVQAAKTEVAEGESAPGTGFKTH